MGSDPEDPDNGDVIKIKKIVWKEYFNINKIMFILNNCYIRYKILEILKIFYKQWNKNCFFINKQKRDLINNKMNYYFS